MSTKLKRSAVTCSAFKRTPNFSTEYCCVFSIQASNAVNLVLTQDLRSFFVALAVVFKQRALQTETMQPEENYQPTQGVLKAKTLFTLTAESSPLAKSPGS